MKTQPRSTILRAVAVTALVLASFASEGCTAQSVAQDIVNWTPTIISTSQTVGSIVSGLAPQDAALIQASVVGFDTAAGLLQNQAITYLKNQGLGNLQQLQAQVIAFQGQVNTAILQAAKITNPTSQQQILAAIQGVSTGVVAVIALISTIKGNTLSPASVTAIRVAQVEPLLNRDLSARMVATHYGISPSQARVLYDNADFRVQGLGL